MSPPKTIIVKHSVVLFFFCQVYDENDYRRARFVGRQKEVRLLLKGLNKMLVNLYTSHKIFRLDFSFVISD